jgi:hypothetical protein
MNKIVFMIFLIVILSIGYIWRLKFELVRSQELFDSKSNDYQNYDKSGNSGKLFNYFNWSFMNPYPYPLTQFYSNDKVGI